jgi:hypothetical protein
LVGVPLGNSFRGWFAGKINQAAFRQVFFYPSPERNKIFHHLRNRFSGPKIIFSAVKDHPSWFVVKKKIIIEIVNI